MFFLRPGIALDLLGILAWEFVVDVWNFCSELDSWGKVRSLFGDDL